MKRGIRRIEPRVAAWQIDDAARECLRTLRDALELAKDAGACYTAARIRHAISSAKGAIRAAAHRKG